MDIVNRCMPPIYLMSGMIIAVMKKNADCSGLPIAQVVEGHPHWVGDLDYSYFYRELSDCLKLQNKTWSDLEGRWLYKHRRLKGL
jgi:hypothetical protein